MEDGKLASVFVHKLVAYQKFGDDAFAQGVMVRHLDGDSLNNRPSNILIGSASNNSMDRAAETRQKVAQLAGRANGRYTEDEWLVIKQEREAGASYTYLNKKYGLSNGTLAYRFSKAAKSRALINR